MRVLRKRMSGRNLWALFPKLYKAVCTFRQSRLKKLKVQVIVWVPPSLEDNRRLFRRGLTTLVLKLL